jgi:hypothetical protein
MVLVETGIKEAGFIEIKNANSLSKEKSGYKKWLFTFR